MNADTPRPGSHGNSESAGQQERTAPHPDALDAILRSLEAVEQGLHLPLQIADLAAAAGYSLFHFTRLFNQIVHLSPFDYLIRRRLTMASNDLQNPDLKILDTALNYQFSSHESFTRAFKRIFGAPPSQFRSRPPDPHNCLNPVNKDMLQLMHSGTLHIQKQTLPEQTVAGLAAQVKSDDCLPVSLLQQLKENAAGHTLQDSRMCFLYLYPRGWHIHGVQVLAGCLQPPAASIPMPLHRAIPPSTWASFRITGHPPSRSLLQRFIHQIWLPGQGLKLKEPLELEILQDSPHRQTVPPAAELLIPVTTG